MVLSMRKWWARAKFIALFLVFTYVIYHVLHNLSSWIAPHHRFGEPSGHAVKAYAAEEAARDSAAFGDRLRFFYWYGE